MNVETELGLGQSTKEATTGNKPRGYWQDPANVEAESRAVLEAGLELKYNLLKKPGFGYTSLATAIEHYPGGIHALREKLGLPIGKRSQGYWGRDPQTIEQKAQEALDAGIGLTSSQLTEGGMASLINLAGKHYPGGLRALKEKMGIKVDTKPNGFWKDPQNIESEARQAIESGIPIAGSSLLATGRSSLVAAIHMYYPGGIKALREKFNQPQGPKEKGFWTPETIELEVQKAMDQGLELSGSQTPALYVAAQRHYPGGITELRKKLGVGKSKKPDGFWQDTSKIEEETRKAIEAGIRIDQKSLAEAGLSGLSTAITKYYPGTYKALRAKLEIKQAPKPGKKSLAIDWETLKNTPAFVESIEEMATEFVSTGHALTQDELKTAGFIWQAIRFGYPGGIGKLRTNLRKSEKPTKLKTTETRAKGYWQDEANIEAELSRIIDQIGHFPTQLELKELRMTVLNHALQTTGGVNAWRQRLSQDIIKRDTGYWDSEENVEKEIIRVLTEHDLDDLPSTGQLGQLGEAALGRGIIRSGGFHRWRERLGFSARLRPRDYWMPETVEKEGREFYEQHGELSSDALAANKRFDLQVAAGRHFPGGLTALRIKLGIPTRKPEGYWTVETIEKEAREFYERNGTLSFAQMRKAKRDDLLNAIVAHYPGRINALKEKFGIGGRGNLGENVHPDRANEQLAKLLEVQR